MSEEVIDGYRLMKVMTTGQTSQVWEVVEQSSHRHFAMKLLLPEHVTNPEHRRFLFHDNGWEPYCGRVDVTEVPGDHDSMVLEPAVRVRLEEDRLPVDFTLAELFVDISLRVRSKQAALPDPEVAAATSRQRSGARRP